PSPAAGDAGHESDVSDATSTSSDWDTSDNDSDDDDTYGSSDIDDSTDSDDPADSEDELQALLDSFVPPEDRVGTQGDDETDHDNMEVEDPDGNPDYGLDGGDVEMQSRSSSTAQTTHARASWMSSS